jgi:hypothetical protein
MGRRILGRWNKAAVDNPVYLSETRWRAHDKMGIERFRRIAVQDEKRLIGLGLGATSANTSDNWLSGASMGL